MGLIYNGHDFGDRLRVNPTRAVLPQIEVSPEEVSGRHGAVVTGVRMQPLTISVDVLLRGGAGESLMDVVREEIAPYLYSEEPKPLVLPDEPDRYYLAVFRGKSELDRPLFGAKTSFEFYCADPIAYGEHHSETVPATVTVGGRAPSWPTVEAVPPEGLAVWRVTVNDDQFVEVIANFDGEARLVIDMEHEAVTYGGQTAEVSIYSDFFQIEGEAVISATSEATVEWDERWR